MKRNAIAIAHLTKMAPKLLTLSNLCFNPTISLGVRFPNCKTEDMVNSEKRNDASHFYLFGFQ
jgi:hypothetical protein